MCLSTLVRLDGSARSQRSRPTQWRGQRRRHLPGKHRLAGDGERIQKKRDGTVEPVRPREPIGGREPARAGRDGGHRVAVREPKGLGELIRRPALGRARRLDAAANQLWREGGAHGRLLSDGGEDGPPPTVPEWGSAARSPARA